MKLKGVVLNGDLIVEPLGKVETIGAPVDDGVNWNPVDAGVLGLRSVFAQWFLYQLFVCHVNFGFKSSL